MLKEGAKAVFFPVMFQFNLYCETSRNYINVELLYQYNKASASLQLLLCLRDYLLLYVQNQTLYNTKNANVSIHYEPEMSRRQE